MDNLHQLSVKQISEALQQKQFSSVEITQQLLGRIKELDDAYNSFITVCEQQALEDAAAADARIAKGESGDLLGVPMAHKDIFCTDGIRTSCGSKMLDNFIAPYDATVVSKLKQAGCVNLGKTNMDEFAMGSSNETSFYGSVQNPWQDNLVPGGSSGGSAAAVAARLVPATTGTDTGGSIRQPAALCGITGLKPTYGTVSRYGMIAFASSLDQAGPMTRTAEDAAIFMNAMAGHDKRDSTSLNREYGDYTAKLNNSLKGLKIGLPKEYFDDRLNPDIADAVNTAIKTLEALGATLVDISLPSSGLSVPAYYVIAPAEASSNLSRFDGVRYGYRCEHPQNLEDLHTRTRSEGFGEEVKRRILVGTYALSAGYYDAYYAKAQKIRRLIANDFTEAFSKVDVIIGPTSPSPAFTKGSKQTDPISMYLEDIYTIAVNLAGLPAMSVPAGKVSGLPVGMQIMGKAFDEATLLNVAHQFQQATNWHLDSPVS